MYILGLSFYYHESAAALIKDGVVIAALEEERFSRKKHDSGFPTQAINFCLNQAGISATDLAYVVFYEKPFLKLVRHLQNSANFFPHSRAYFVHALKNSLTQKLWVKSIILEKLELRNSNLEILFIPHHLSHAASAFYTSPFDKAAFLTIDGVGESATASWGIASNKSLYPKKQLLFPHSVGLLYSAFTAFLGFTINDGEFKVMGMAGYGKPKYVDLIKKIYIQNPDSSLTLNLEYFKYHLSDKTMYSDKFINLFTSCNRFDLAASLQFCLQEIITNIVRHIQKTTRQTNLVYAGGVALNSVVNASLLTNTGFKKLYVFPAAGDDGGSVGAALYAYHHFLHFPRTTPITNVFWGQEFSSGQITHFLNSKSIPYRRLSDPKLFEYISQKLALGKVVGWFDDKSEFGPRALGHRSILADPGHPEMKDLVNSKIKFREEFRPFAPAVLSSQASKYFHITTPLLAPFMLATFTAKPLTKRVAPAIVHVDGTSRIQTVSHGRFQCLLSIFFRQTGLPMLLNTSFNLKGEPIVNSPADAYNTFINSGLDLLVLGNYVVSKSSLHH